MKPATADTSPNRFSLGIAAGIAIAAVVVLVGGLGYFIGRGDRSRPVGPTRSGTAQDATSGSMEQRFLILEKELDNNKQRVNDTLNIFVGLGGIATLGLLLFGFMSWYRDERQEKSYRRERDFYEDRQRQERRDYRLERWLHERREGRQARIEADRSQQELDMGAKGLQNVDRLIAAQIDNLSGLGQVIDLVRQSSKIKLDRETHQEELEKLISDIKNDAEQRYAKAESDSLRFSDVTALRWPSLPEERRRIASSACRTFEQIQDFVLTEKKTKHPLEYARLLHFLGIFSYYADHSVESALHYLEEAESLFAGNIPSDFRNNQAYTRHFLGVLQKNWPLRLEPPGTNLREAKNHLDAAERFLTIESGSF